MLFSTRKASSVHVPASILQNIEKDDLSTDEKTTLQELEFLTENQVMEKKEMLGFVDDLNAMDRTFKSAVVMNLDCNLACTYCFEGQRKGRHYMSEETADQLVSYIKNAVLPGKEEVNIVFYGGEPLLSIERIMSISGRLKALAKDMGVKYIASLITNATLLTPAVAEKLKTAGLETAAVTLDGLKEIHDVQRPFRSGKGSFEVIIRNLREVCGMINIRLGGRYTRANYREFPFLLDYLKKEGIGPDKLQSVKFTPVFNETPEFAPAKFRGGCECVNEPWIYESSIFLREEILRRGYRTDRVRPSPCMLEFDNRMVFNYNGDIYKCPGFIGREAFKAGDIRTGLTDYRKAYDLDNWKNEECLNCAYLPLCFGGCRYMKLIREGNMDGVDCKKPYLDAVLESLILQDIKYPDQLQKS